MLIVIYALCAPSTESGDNFKLVASDGVTIEKWGVLGARDQNTDGPQPPPYRLQGPRPSNVCARMDEVHESGRPAWQQGVHMDDEAFISRVGRDPPRAWELSRMRSLRRTPGEMRWDWISRWKMGWDPKIGRYWISCLSVVSELELEEFGWGSNGLRLRVWEDKHVEIRAL